MTARIHTPRLELIAKTRADVDAMLKGMTTYERAQVSANWLALLEAAGHSNPWVHGFSAARRDDGVAIGTGGYTGPPVDGVVEIAYSVNEEFRGKGFATEIAGALVEYAFASGDVAVARAHTLPDGIASQRILLKCGFTQVAEIQDPIDGLIWRYERAKVV
jgi:RimJ/RimL family protein N-acetyltransferase